MKEELFDDLILERGYEYAQEGAHCKHMAAVMYYLDGHPVYDEHVLIDALSEKQAKQLLKSILKDHPEYFDQLPNVEKKEEIKESVEEAFRNHPDIKSARGYIVKCIDEYYDIDVLIHTRVI